MVILPTSRLKGSRARKGKKRQRAFRYGQVKHKTLKGKGIVVRLRD